MIDMGTATTISYISAKRSYEGGLMSPGAAESGRPVGPHRPAAGHLPAAPQEPHRQKHRGTHALRHCLRHRWDAGTGVIDRIREVLPQGETPTIVATGSNAPVIVRYCRNKVLYDKYLLMEGLWDIYQKNH